MPEERFDLNQGIRGKYSALKVFHYPKKLTSFLDDVLADLDDA